MYTYGTQDTDREERRRDASRSVAAAKASWPLLKTLARRGLLECSSFGARVSGSFLFFPTLEGTRREKTEEEVARYFDNVSAARKGRVALFTLAAGASRRSDAVLFVDITAQRRPGARR